MMEKIITYFDKPRWGKSLIMIEEEEDKMIVFLPENLGFYIHEIIFEFKKEHIANIIFKNKEGIDLSHICPEMCNQIKSTLLESIIAS
jgi:hypothetical protein